MMSFDSLPSIIHGGTDFAADTANDQFAHLMEVPYEKDNHMNPSLAVSAPSTFLNPIIIKGGQYFIGAKWGCFGLYLPDKYTNIILGIAICRNRRDACSHCYLAVNLNKAWAEEVVATGGLVCITLKYIHRTQSVRGKSINIPIKINIQKTTWSSGEVEIWKLRSLQSSRWKVLCYYHHIDLG